MKKGMIFLVILTLVVLSAIIYFTFFFSYRCDSAECFIPKHEACTRSTYESTVDGATWLYKVMGKESGMCKVQATMLRISEGSLEQESLEGKSMICLMQIGDTSNPESSIGDCHGLLKEGLQEIIIKKLHQYVLDNLKEIGEDFEDI